MDDLGKYVGWAFGLMFAAVAVGIVTFVAGLFFRRR